MGYEFRPALSSCNDIEYRYRPSVAISFLKLARMLTARNHARVDAIVGELQN